MESLNEETKTAFRSKHGKIDLQHLHNTLPKVTEQYHCRGVYMCIAWHTDGRWAIYVGSSRDLALRVKAHIAYIRAKSKHLHAYRVLSQDGWKMSWHVLGVCLKKAHQFDSSMLLTNSVDSTRPSAYHPAGARRLAAACEDPGLYKQDNVLRLNYALPLKQGFSLKDDRPKECFNCGVKSDGPFPPSQGFRMCGDSPFRKYECYACRHNRLSYGSVRTAEHQHKLDVRNTAKAKYHKDGREVPDRCDWCGNDKGKQPSGPKGEYGKHCPFGAFVGMYLCTTCVKYDRKKELPRPRTVIFEAASCSQCHQERGTNALKWIPYPQAQLLCLDCLKLDPHARALRQAQHHVDWDNIPDIFQPTPTSTTLAANANQTKPKKPKQGTLDSHFGPVKKTTGIIVSEHGTDMEMPKHSPFYHGYGVATKPVDMLDIEDHANKENLRPMLLKRLPVAARKDVQMTELGNESDCEDVDESDCEDVEENEWEDVDEV
jgi:hypothetical protein